jgi:hypothetical protein
MVLIIWGRHGGRPSIALQRKDLLVFGAGFGILLRSNLQGFSDDNGRNAARRFYGGLYL